MPGGEEWGWVGAIVVFIGGAGTGLLGWLTSRRSTSGHIGTSEAEQLWAATQNFQQLILADKQKAEEQRDRLLELQRTESERTLGSVIELIKEIAEQNNELRNMGTKILTGLEKLGELLEPRKRQVASTDDGPAP